MSDLGPHVGDVLVCSCCGAEARVVCSADAAHDDGLEPARQREARLAAPSRRRQASDPAPAPTYPAPRYLVPPQPKRRHPRSAPPPEPKGEGICTVRGCYERVTPKAKGVKGPARTRCLAHLTYPKRPVASHA